MRSYRTIVQLIAATTTDTGLRVRAELDQNEYPKGAKVTNAELTGVNLSPHSFERVVQSCPWRWPRRRSVSARPRMPSNRALAPARQTQTPLLGSTWGGAARCLARGRTATRRRPRRGKPRPSRSASTTCRRPRAILRGLQSSDDGRCVSRRSRSRLDTHPLAVLSQCHDADASCDLDFLRSLILSHSVFRPRQRNSALAIPPSWSMIGNPSPYAGPAEPIFSWQQ